MKIASVILAVLVTILTTIPCDSSCGELTEIESQSHTQDDHDDHSDADNCSPFCVCNCCQTNIVLMEAFHKLNIPDSETEFIARGEDFQFISLFELWRPPKV